MAEGGKLIPVVEGDTALEATVERRLLREPQGPFTLAPNDPNIKVIIGIPMERTIHQKAFFGFSEILVQGWPLARLEYTRNDIARHKFAEFLLETEYTHLLMLDSDHIHPATVVQRLARWFAAYPEVVRVIGGLNFRRGEPFDPCAFVDPGDGSYRRMAEWGHGAIEVEALGTGSIMIERSVFEELPKPWFAYDYSKWEGWPGTDMWFSELCRKAGIALWCDTTTTSPHIGDMLIDETSYRAWIAANGVPPNEKQ
jgi:hypothetical protein